MQIHFDKPTAAALRAALENCEDAQETGRDEFVVDLFDAQPPLSVELCFDGEGVQALAAGVLAYSEELDGWYLADPVTQADVIENALRTLL